MRKNLYTEIGRKAMEKQKYALYIDAFFKIYG